MLKRIKYKKSIIVILLLSLITWVLLPIYNFFAHNDKLPLPFWGWVEQPKNVPIKSRVYDKEYDFVGNKVLQLLKKHKQNIKTPAITVAVAVDGNLIWNAALGWQSIERKEPITLKSRFRIGSTSKAITAIVLARLVQREKIDLDLPIESYLGNLANKKWKNITIRQLASHMSGLPHYKDNTEIIGLYKTVALQTHYESMLKAIEIFDDSDLLFEPGTQFSYSSLGTVLIGAVMEAVENKSYLQIVEAELLEPMNLESIAISPRSADLLDDMATSYKGRNGEVRPWREVDLSHRLPGGGLIGSSKELALIGQAMLSNDFLDEKIVEQFWTPQKLTNGEANHQNYALGWRKSEWQLSGIGKIEYFNHGGVSKGAQSWLMVLPEHRMSVAVNINRKTEEFSDFASIGKEIANAFILAKSISEK